MTIPRNEIPYVTMKTAPEAIKACFGTYIAAATAIGYKPDQLRRWASRGILPRPVYDRLAKASPTPFPRFGRTKWIRGGRNFGGVDSNESLRETAASMPRRSKRTTTPVRPTLTRETSPTTVAPDALTAIQQLIGELQQIRAERDQLKAKLSTLREALV